MSQPPILPPDGEFLLYSTEDGQARLEVRLSGETVWLSQAQMAELFQTTKQNVGQHIRKIFDDGELQAESVVKDFFTTAADGKRYATHFYNLDAIISVGYRVKSAVATLSRFQDSRLLGLILVKRKPSTSRSAPRKPSKIKE